MPTIKVNLIVSGNVFVFEDVAGHAGGAAIAGRMYARHMEEAKSDGRREVIENMLRAVEKFARQ